MAANDVSFSYSSKILNSKGNIELRAYVNNCSYDVRVLKTKIQVTSRKIGCGKRRRVSGIAPKTIVKHAGFIIDTLQGKPNSRGSVSFVARSIADEGFDWSRPRTVVLNGGEQVRRTEAETAAKIRKALKGADVSWVELVEFMRKAKSL